MKAILIPTVIGLIGILTPGCISAQQAAQVATDTKTTVQLAKDACVIIHKDLPNDPTGQQLCAKEEELKPFFDLILGGRARPQVVSDGGTKK